MMGFPVISSQIIGFSCDLCQFCRDKNQVYVWIKATKKNGGGCREIDGGFPWCGFIL